MSAPEDDPREEMPPEEYLAELDAWQVAQDNAAIERGEALRCDHCYGIASRSVDGFMETDGTCDTCGLPGRTYITGATGGEEWAEWQCRCEDCEGDR